MFIALSLKVIFVTILSLSYGKDLLKLFRDIAICISTEKHFYEVFSSVLNFYL